MKRWYVADRPVPFPKSNFAGLGERSSRVKIYGRWSFLLTATFSFLEADSIGRAINLSRSALNRIKPI